MACNTPIASAIFTKLKMIKFQSIFIFLPQRHRGAEQSQNLLASSKSIFPLSSSLCLCVSVAKLNCYRRSRVTERRPRQTVERGNVLRHFVEQTFDGHKTVLAGDIVNEVM